MITFPLITTWMWFEAAMAVQSLSNNTLRKLVAGLTVAALQHPTPSLVFYPPLLPARGFEVGVNGPT
jgi:hypothetical protein